MKLGMVLLWVCLSLVPAARAAHVAQVGDPAPSALGRSAQGEELRVEDLRGTVIVATFWASWCSPCRQEMSLLENLQQEIDPSALRVVAINFQEPLRDYRKIVKALGDLKLTLTHDKTGSLSRPYGVKAIPYMVLIDHEGRIAAIHKGFDEDGLDQLVDEINALLEKRERAIMARAPAATS